MLKTSASIVNLQEKIRKMYILKKTYEDMLEIIEKHYPLEACGLLLGDVKNEIATVKEVKEVENVLESVSMFWFDVKKWMEIILEAKKRGLEYIGLFHSHVKASPIPSLADRHRMLECPEEIWVIISYRPEAKFDVMAWRIDDFGFSIMKIDLIIM